MKILFIGDIVGKPGRRTVAELLPGVKADVSPDFIVANGENIAGGIGVTKETALEVFRSGVDVLTLGNHVFARKDVCQFLDEEPRILRPANYPAGVPGRGWAVYSAGTGQAIALINLSGRVFMAEHLEDPFRVSDGILEEAAARTKVVLVDFHGEATSEKGAFAWYADGRVTAVVGTHTHVQTADERILPGGTACITDVGMTGPVDSVIGVRKELIISRFLTQMPNKFEVADGEAVLSAVLIEADPATGRALRIERIQVNRAPA